jgi:hypothetical protein
VRSLLLSICRHSELGYFPLSHCRSPRSLNAMHHLGEVELLFKAVFRAQTINFSLTSADRSAAMMITPVRGLCLLIYCNSSSPSDSLISGSRRRPIRSNATLPPADFGHEFISLPLKSMGEHHPYGGLIIDDQYFSPASLRMPFFTISLGTASRNVFFAVMHNTLPCRAALIRQVEKALNRDSGLPSPLLPKVWGYPPFVCRQPFFPAPPQTTSPRRIAARP